MGCFGCLGNSKSKEEKPLIIDVEQTIADAAWEMFLASHGRCARHFIRRKNFKIDVPMNYYHFEQVEQEIKPRKRRPPGAVDSGCQKSPGKSLLDGKQLAHRDQTSPEHIGLQTEFNNDTNETQNYHFQFEKRRTASINVAYQKGYSIGGKANFSLGLPKILSDGSVGAEVDMNVQVSKTTGETFEESLTTTATSDITVSPNSHYIASVVMEERSLLADFKVVIMMIMPARRAPVYIKDKTGEVVFVYSLNNLPGLFENIPDVERVKDEEQKVRSDAVRFTIEGIVDGMQLSSHRINLCDQSKKSQETAS